MLLPVLAAAVTAPSVGAHEAGRATARVVAPALRAGDLFTDHGLTVRVPRPGGWVWGELKLADGTWQEVAVETDRDGRVWVRGGGDERRATLAQRGVAAGAGGTSLDAGRRAELAAAVAGANGECNDEFKNLYWWRLPRLEWRFNPAGTPAYLLDDDGSTTSVQAALERAQANITGAVNRCSRPDRVGARGSLIGLTKGTPNVAAGGRCTGGNGRSVIGFGSLPSSSIAMTCVYGIGGNQVASEADIRINTVAVRWATSRATCKGEELLLEAGLTHEFGHAYGLAHASTYRNPYLTMQPLIRACSQGPSTLGLGDMLGLEKKY